LAVDLDSPIKRARLAAAFALERLRQQVADARSKQYPGDHIGPIRWLNLVSGLIDTAFQYLNESTKSGISGDVEAALIADAAQLATESYQCLVLMRGAGTDELSYSIVSPLQRWFTQLGVTNATFFRAELVANYELSFIPQTPFKRVRNPAPSLIEAQHIEWPFLRVTVPAKAFSIVPHLAIVAHEIGHALFDRITWDISSFVRSEVPALLDKIKQRMGKQDLDASTIKILNNVFKSWWEEFSADAFAFFLTGPAIFFSLPEFFQFLGTGYGLSDTHPANDLRRRALFDKICDGGKDSFAAVFKQHLEQDLSVEFNSPLIVPAPFADDRYTDMISEGYSPATAAVITELHESIDKLIPLVYAHVREFLERNAKGAIYCPGKFNTDLTDHLEALLGAVPPIEVGGFERGKTPTEFASILNVGWAVLLTRLRDLRVKTSGTDPFGSEKAERLQGLLSKAVELSEARRAWQA
jgi:hypothetical protein